MNPPPAQAEPIARPNKHPFASPMRSSLRSARSGSPAVTLPKGIRVHSLVLLKVCHRADKAPDPRRPGTATDESRPAPGTRIDPEAKWEEARGLTNKRIGCREVVISAGGRDFRRIRFMNAWCSHKRSLVNNRSFVESGFGSISF